MLSKSTLLIVLLSSARVLAEGGAHGAAHGEAHLDEATLQTIIYQAINVGVIIVALVYFLRKPVKEFFANKHQTFVVAAERAQLAQKKAEDERRQIEIQLQRLEQTTQESVSRAKAEATDLRNSLVAEAQALSKRIQDEGHATAVLEVEKAKNALRIQMIDEATKLAQSEIGGAVSTDDHARLNKEFIQNIEVVQR